MKATRFARQTLATVFSLVFASCTTSHQALNKNPASVSTSALCRSLTSTKDVAFQQSLYVELTRRSVSPSQCVEMVTKQNQAIVAGLAVAALGAAVAVCANNDCGGGGGYTPNYDRGADWDQFYNQYGQLVWACREIGTGQFTYEYNCSGKIQSDWRWPSKYG